MSAYIVWLDHNHAKLFKMHTGKVTPEKLHRHEIKHHDSRDPENHKNSEKFFHEIAGALKDSKEIVLVGPGLAKEHFKSHLERHHHADIAKHIVGMETVDHPTDAQIVALARKLFKTIDLFEG